MASEFVFELEVGVGRTFGLLVWVGYEKSVEARVCFVLLIGFLLGNFLREIFARE